MSRPTQARIDIAALLHNVDIARKLAPHSKLMAVVKADAYGHGAVAISHALDTHVDALAVACLEEAAALREAGIRSPILLLEGVFSAAELAPAAQLELWLTIGSEAQLTWLEQATLSAPLSCWLKVDTGMHRLGVEPVQTDACFNRLQASNNAASDVVVYTHFAAAENAQSDSTARQLALFNAIPLLADHTTSPLRSTANSAGLLAWPQAHFDWVRPGYMLYGNSPLPPEDPASQSLQPVMSLTSAITSLRNIESGAAVGYGGSWVATRSSHIATVAIGYGDGYPRQAPNGTPVMVRGQRAPLAGCVSMDMITIDVTDIAGVQLGDEVLLWGPGLPLAEIARSAGTVGYELITRMPARTPRVVING